MQRTTCALHTMLSVKPRIAKDRLSAMRFCFLPAAMPALSRKGCSMVGNRKHDIGDTFISVYEFHVGSLNWESRHSTPVDKRSMLRGQIVFGPAACFVSDLTFPGRRASNGNQPPEALRSVPVVPNVPQMIALLTDPGMGVV